MWNVHIFDIISFNNIHFSRHYSLHYFFYTAKFLFLLLLSASILGIVLRSSFIHCILKISL